MRPGQGRECIMKINIAELRKGVGEFRELHEEFFLDMEPAGKEPQKVCFDGTISNVGKTFLLRGTARAAFALFCVRCLKAFSIEERVLVEEEFTEKPQEVSSEMQWNISEVNRFSGQVVDISESLRDALLVHVPMQPLCSENCLGLCEQCGKNLNEGACACAHENADPRFEKLKTLFEK